MFLLIDVLVVCVLHSFTRLSSLACVSEQKTALPGDQESVAPPSASSSSSSEVQTLKRQQEVLQSKLLQLETALRTSSAAAEEGGAHKEVRQKMQTLEMQNADLKAQLEQLQKAVKAQAIRYRHQQSCDVHDSVCCASDGTLSETDPLLTVVWRGRIVLHRSHLCLLIFSMGVCG